MEAENKPLTRDEVSKLSNTDLLLMIARESLTRFGTALPPSTLPAPKQAVRIDWTKEIHECPHCGAVGTVAVLFGIRVYRGVERKQSWCKTCRASEDSHPSRQH